MAEDKDLESTESTEESDLPADESQTDIDEETPTSDELDGLDAGALAAAEVTSNRPMKRKQARKLAEAGTEVEPAAEEAVGARPKKKDAQTAEKKGVATPKRNQATAEEKKKSTTPAQFVRESAAELRKTVWPTGEQLRNYFTVVLAFVLFIIIFCWGLDTLFGWALLSWLA
ncbi:MAG: preprotein translocase subunit SecE [Propionibacteriaceae bacterium]